MLARNTCSIACVGVSFLAYNAEMATQNSINNLIKVLRVGSVGSA